MSGNRIIPGMKSSGFRCSIAIAASVVSLFVATAPAADRTIADLAPPDSIAVLAVDDYPAMREALGRTALSSLLLEPEIQNWFAGFWTKDAETWRESTRERGVDPDRLPRPAGAVGAAVWLDDRAVSPVRLHTLISAEMGADAELLLHSIDSIAAAAERDDMARSSDTEIAGLPARRIELTKLDASVRLGDQSVIRAAAEFFIVRVDDLVLVCTDPAELELAVARARGEREPTLRDRDELARARALIAPASIEFAVLAEPFFEMIARAAESDAGRAAFGAVELDMRRILGALGLSAAEAYAAGASFDGAEAMVDARAALLASRKEGLLALADAPIEGLTPPDSVPAHALDARQFGLRYAEVIPALLRLIDTMPDEARGQARAMVGLMTAAIGPLFQSLGPDTVVARWRSQPIAPDSERGVLGVRTRDPNAVAVTLGQVGPLLGLRRRNAAGAATWRLGNGQMLTLEADRLIVGDSDSIAATRGTRPAWGETRLIDADSFRRATRPLRPGAVFYSFTNLAANVRWLEWRDRNWEAILRAELAESRLSRREIDDWVEKERLLRADRRTPPIPQAEVFTRHVGDAVAEIRSTDEGFVYRGWWFAAEN